VHVPMAYVPSVHSPETVSQIPVLDRRHLSKLAFPQVDRAAQRFTFPLHRFGMMPSCANDKEKMLDATFWSSLSGPREEPVYHAPESKSGG
jgi:hypothetical protein